jgi:hypothetical protein
VEIVDYFNDNQYGPKVLADEPVAYYRMKEASGLAVMDSTGAHGGAALSGTGVTYAQRGGLRSDTSPVATPYDPLHNYDNCLGFDGINGEAVVATFPAPGASHSVECLVKTTTTAAASLLGMVNLGLYVEGGSHGGVRFTDNHGHDVTTSKSINDGAWHHVAATYDGLSQTATLYIDGAVAGVARGSFASPLASVLRIASDDRGNRLRGLLDEVAIYNFALSAPRVVAHHDAAQRARLVHDIDLMDIRVSSGAGAGAVVERCSHIRFRRLDLQGCSLAVADVESVSLEQCQCRAGPWSALLVLDTVSDAHIDGGVYTGEAATAFGISGQYVARAKWVGAVIRGCAESGISLQDSTGVEVGGCSIGGNGIYGVVESGDSHDNVAAHNDLRGNGAPAGRPGLRSRYTGNIV